MDYTEQFIRLNCSLMSDYKMMKLNADMKCMGLGLYLETILFLRKQQEYKHDFNELDLLADQWGATVENLQHLIKDFDLFLITEDGYFRCLYLDDGTMSAYLLPVALLVVGGILYLVSTR